MRRIQMILFLFSFSYSYYNIDPDTLLQWISGTVPFDFILIDIREERNVSSVIGNGSCAAYNFPFISGEFEEMVERFPLDTPIILYCRTGNTSAQVASELEYIGFSRIYSLTDGILSWNGPTVPVDEKKPDDLFPEVFCPREISVLIPVTACKTSSRPALFTGRICDLQGRLCKADPSATILKTGNSRTGAKIQPLRLK